MSNIKVQEPQELNNGYTLLSEWTTRIGDRMLAVLDPDRKLAIYKANEIGVYWIDNKDEGYKAPKVGFRYPAFNDDRIQD